MPLTLLPGPPGFKKLSTPLEHVCRVSFAHLNSNPSTLPAAIVLASTILYIYYWVYLRRNRKDGTKDRRVLHCRAVPLVVPELELAFGDAVAGAPAYVHHVVCVEHAEFLLPTGEAGDLVAEASCTIPVFGAQHKKVRMLQGTHSMHSQIPEINKYYNV